MAHAIRLFDHIVRTIAMIQHRGARVSSEVARTVPMQRDPSPTLASRKFSCGSDERTTTWQRFPCGSESLVALDPLEATFVREVMDTDIYI